MPKPTVTAALVVAALLVAAIAATAILLPGAEPKELEVPPPDEAVMIYPDSRDPNDPVACMFELDCLMRQIEAATGVPVAPSPPVEVAPSAWSTIA